MNSFKRLQYLVGRASSVFSVLDPSRNLGASSKKFAGFLPFFFLVPKTKLFNPSVIGDADFPRLLGDQNSSVKAVTFFASGPFLCRIG